MISYLIIHPRPKFKNSAFHLLAFVLYSSTRTTTVPMDLPVDLSAIPALPAPEGWTTDFNSPVNRAVQYIAVSSIVVPMAFVCVLLKLYMKITVIRKPGWDDCKCTAADHLIPSPNSLHSGERHRRGMRVAFSRCPALLIICRSDLSHIRPFSSGVRSSPPVRWLRLTFSSIRSGRGKACMGCLGIPISEGD